MAKGILDKVDTNIGGDKSAGLGYGNIPSPVVQSRPPAGLLKKILSQSKESEQFSPYKKSTPKPTEIKRKTAQPAPVPVQAAPIITPDVLEPVTKANVEANQDLKTAIESTVAKKFKPGTIPEDVYRSNLAKGIETGDFKIVDSEDGGREIIRSAPGFLGGFVEGWNGYWNGLQESLQSYNPFTSEEEKIALREARRRDNSIIIQQEQDKATEYGQMTGGIAGQVAPMILSGGSTAVATRAAGLAAGAINLSKANSALQTVIGTLTQANQSEDEAYNLMRDKGLSPEDANEVAKANRLTYATTGALESALSSIADAKIAKFFSAGTKKAGDGFLNATKQYLNKLKEPATSLALDASVAGLASSIRDLATESTTGVDLNILDRAWENAKQELIAGGAIATVSGAAGAASRKVDKWFKSQATNYLATLDRKFVEDEFKNQVNLGMMTEDQAKQELDKIDKWNEIKKNNPTVAEEKMPTVYGLILAKGDLQDAAKKADPATGSIAEIEAKIADIDRRIKEAMENPDPLAGEEYPETGYIDMRPLMEQQITEQQNQQTDATTISEQQQQEGGAESDISQRQGIEGEQAQAPNEADNRDSNIVSEEGEKVIPSVSVSKLLGQTTKKITVNEKVALRRLLKFGETSAKGAIKFSKEAKAGIAEGLKNLGKKGIIKVSQFNDIIAKFNNVDVTNKSSVDKFVQYASKKIADANYDAKLKEANRLKGLIAKNAKRESGQVNISMTGKDFASLNPADIEDIDKYIKIAGAVLQGTKPSRASGTGVEFNQPFSDKDIASYTNEEKANIEEARKTEKMAEYQEMVDAGVITSDMSFDEMNDIISLIEEDPKQKPAIDKEKDIRNYVNRRFQTLSAMAKSMLDKGSDGFGTDVDVEITPEQKRVINDLLKTDTKGMSITDAYRAIEGLSNFVTNGTSSGLDAVVKRYNGAKNSFDLSKTGVKSRPMRLYFSTTVGRLWSKNLDTLPMKLIRMFGSNTAPKFARAMGLYDLEDGKNRAVIEHSKMEKEWNDSFEKSKPNGEDFNTARNVTERGMVAFATRTVFGTPKEMQAEFDRRKLLIEESIDALITENTDESNRKADLYQEAYDKVLAESKNIEDVRGKADKSNVEMVDWWTNKWNSKYDRLRDVSINVYNQDLGKDNNYNPDMYSKIKTEEDASDVFENSGFSSQFEYIPQKKSGTLIKADRPARLPSGRYIDLSFDMNNSRAMKAALVDIETAGNIRQVKSFLDAPTTAKMINGDDLSLLRNSTAEYIKRSRGMEGLGDKELASAKRLLNSATRFVSSTALVGLGQPFKQTLPLIFKTLISTRGRFELMDSIKLMAYKDSPMQRFLENSGYGIALRGAESSTSVMGLDTLIKQANSNIFQKSLDGLDKWNDLLLKAFVSNPDKWVARSSWITYYKSKIDELGGDSSKINWDTHEVNKEAADYAESMVSTQQGVSDRDLMGSFMGSRDAGKTLLRTIALPFSNFSLNAKSKTQSDVVNAFKGATKEDRAAARMSLAGTAIEMAVFNGLSGAIGVMASNLASQGEPLSEKEEEKVYEQAAKSMATNFSGDLLSPLPQTNALVSGGLNSLIDVLDQDTPEELKFRLYADTEKPVWQDFGLFGIGAKKFLDFKDATKMATTGEFKADYYNKETVKTLNDDDKEKAKIAAVLHGLVLSRILPVSEITSYANKITKAIERRSLSEKQANIAEAVKQFPIEGATKVVDGKNLSQAIAKAASYKDPESKAKYLLGLAEKYGSDFSKGLELARDAKYLDNGTMANLQAMIEEDKDNIEVARIFSYKDQDARAYKLMQLRDLAEKENRLEGFYKGLQFGMSYKLLNEGGLRAYIERLPDYLTEEDEEVQMLMSIIED